ncbi:RNA polymerase sigma factor [Hymenobacter psychrophilus]|uniref:RNA polymerase sigma-70 factor, ECF subfamily n=1 Tax=Hymenobacter psychrophilus TaxID=651662 RepID=A0A1H3LCY0_9BACT|nr:sigma-70 family RNA polymerase sigma factor [Hymenobacter psychrophilus]SDY61798.1 RNA polymerase sigma-70 factor, ECF subfamily [Hymenobacter psychrophilus]
MPVSPPLSDEDLLAALRAGSAGAFEQVVQRYGARVLNTCLGLVPHRPDAEDLTQEVFVEVYTQLAGFRGEAKLSTWVYRIAVNKCLEWQRYRKRQKRFAFLTSLFGTDDGELLHDPPDYEHPGVLAERQEQATILRQAVARLPERQQVAFTLFHLEGLPHQEIADALGLGSVGAVESLLHRARATLRQRLGAYYREFLAD